jgi:hypothetical protein
MAGGGSWERSPPLDGVHLKEAVQHHKSVQSKEPTPSESRFSLAPGFSPVEKGKADKSRFNGFPQRVKAAEAAPSSFRPQPPG